MFIIKFSQYYFINNNKKNNMKKSPLKKQLEKSKSQSKSKLTSSSTISQNISSVYFCHYKNAMYMGGIKAFKK